VSIIRRNTVVSPDDGHIFPLNIQRLIDILRISCAPSWLYLQDLRGLLVRPPVRETNLSSSAEHPKRFCGPPSLLFDSLFGSFLRVRAGSREADHSPPTRAEVKNAWKYSSTVIVGDLYGVVLK